MDIIDMSRQDVLFDLQSALFWLSF